MKRRVMEYPLWLRLWHWTNAVFFLALIVSGLALHYASPANTILPFQTALIIHNFTGIALSIAYLAFLLGNYVTSNGRHYLPTRAELSAGAWNQLKYYLVGIFRGDPHPHRHAQQRFNPIQKLTYIGIMYVASPVVIATGMVLLFPESIPRQLWNLSGLLPVAVLHSAVGFLLSMFLVAHVYLASTGETIVANYQAMITGYRAEQAHSDYTPSARESTPAPRDTALAGIAHHGEGNATRNPEADASVEGTGSANLARNDS